MFGLFWHKVMNRKIPLVRGFDDMFLAPHSRHTEVPIEDIHNCKELTVLAESDEAGLFLAMADGGRKIFVMGHPEYDRVTLDGEYKRDVSKNLPIEIPENYYKDNNPENRPLLMWRAHANNLYTNWLNYMSTSQLRSTCMEHRISARFKRFARSSISLSYRIFTHLYEKWCQNGVKTVRKWCQN